MFPRAISYAQQLVDYGLNAVSYNCIHATYGSLLGLFSLSLVLSYKMKLVTVGLLLLCIVDSITPIVHLQWMAWSVITGITGAHKKYILYFFYFFIFSYFMLFFLFFHIFYTIF